MARPFGAPRIGVVVGAFPVVSETFVVDQIAGLVELGFEVEILCARLLETPQPPAERLRMLMPLASPSALHRLTHGILRRLGRDAGRDQGLGARWRIEVLADAAACWRMNRCDVLVAHFGWMGQRLAEAAALGVLRRPFVTILHGKDVAVPFRNGELRQYGTLFRRGSLLLPVCDVFRRMLLDAGADPARTRVLPTGVDCAAIPFAPPSPMQAGEARILTTARLVEKKGVDDAIRALAALRRRRPALRWRYDVLGDGPLRPCLEVLAAACGVADRVHFHGAVPHEQAKRHLRSADIFLLPSRTAADGDMEGVPVSLQEAMAAGPVVVSTAHSGIPELITSGETGLLAPEQDVAALAAHLAWAMDNPAGLAALARAARARVEAHFDARAIHGRLRDMLLDLAAGSADPAGLRHQPADRV